MFQVLHSSAGAGKTHALVKHYLSLCLRGEDPAAYRHVLALTFTNKAAAEMKERVMEYLRTLASGSLDKAQHADVMEHLVRVTESDAKTVSQRAGKVIGHMLHHWSDVAISTIDSFTRRVVMPFARELQLDQELEMTTEYEHYRDLAVESLINEAGVDPSMTGLLTEVCLQLLHDERKWDPEKPLLELSKELTKESAMVPLQKLADLDSEKVVALAHELHAQERAFQAKVQGIGKQIMSLLANAGVTEKDLAHGRNGVFGFFKKMAAFDGVPPSAGANVLKTLESDTWHSGSADAQAKAAIDRNAPQLRSCVELMMAWQYTEFRAYTIRKAVRKELLTAYTMHELDKRLEQIKRADGVAFFSDLTRKVAQVVKNEPVPFIHERMGERYRHYLIDEFQDTSLLQWNSLLPLVDEALSNGGSALLVGDAKQAIYRWRNGEVRLFTHFPALFGRDPKDQVEAQREANLQRNYRRAEALSGNHRSASTIITFNNTLFEALAPTLPPQLQLIFQGHAQQVVKEVPGLVDLRVLDHELSGEEYSEAMLEGVLESIREALHDGFVPGDIAVLTRSKKTGSEVATYLVSHGMQVISPDGLKLAHDPLLQLLIDLLRYLHTGEAAPAMRVLQYQAILSSAQDTLTVDPFGATEVRVDAVALLRRWLRANGSPRLRTTLCDLLIHLARAHGYLPGTDVQLLTLLDEAHAWSIKNGQDLGGFLAHWDRSGGERSVVPPKHGQAVQVMTVHRSKGLQFPVVVIPDASMASTRNHGEHFWIRPGTDIPDLEMALVKESKALTEAGVPELQEEVELRLIDAMDLTYVAFTRAEQRLYALIKGSNKDVVTQGITAFMARGGSAEHYRAGERTKPWKTREHEELHHLTDVSVADALAALAIRFEAPTDWDPANPDPHRAYGTAVHAILEKTSTAQDLPAAIKEAVETGQLTEEAAAQLTPQLTKVLGIAALQPWFSKAADIRAEATMITPDGNAVRPDRIVVEGDHARVLDIKTGKPHESHHQQVKGYMHRLKELGYTSVEGALLYVRTATVETVEA